jgi:methionyl-tRNA synthetase
MHAFTPFYSPFTPGFMSIFAPLILAAVVWTIILKGFSLWYAARGSQKWWFFFLLIFNTLGILEIIYLIWFRRDSSHTHHSHHSHTPAHESSPQA